MMVPDFFQKALQERLGEDQRNLLLPPPVFSTLPCEFTAFDRQKGTLAARFPIEQGYLNPYGSVQGGILAGIADNVIGPLSMLIAPPNVTRRFEIKYSRPVLPETEWVEVTAALVSRQGRQMVFSAEIRTPGGDLAARVKATHWLLEP